MRRYISGICAILCVTVASAQDFSGALKQIEENNTTLKQLRSEAEADKLQAQTGLTIADPSVNLAHLWDIKNEGGYRINVGATQTFDFPSVYYWKKRISEGECSAAEIRYSLGRKSILLEAESICISLVYHNAIQKELLRCLDNAEKIAEVWEQKYEAGAASIVELNEAKLGLLSASKAVRENEIERKALVDELCRLNGGVAMDLSDDEFSGMLLPADFEIWYSDAVKLSSELQALENAKTVAASGVKLAKSQWLPKFSIGYVSESNADVSLHGVGFGFSIPLWENKGKVKAAKAREAAAISRAEDELLQFHISLRGKYNKALSMFETSSDYRASLAELSTIDLLYTALEAGEIGVDEYIYGVSLWQDALIEVLACERDCRLLVAELNNFCR